MPPHTASLPGREVVDLLEALREVHGPVDVIVVEGALWGVDRQQRIVHAQTISLCVRVREEAGLQHLVLAELDAWKFTHTHTGDSGSKFSTKSTRPFVSVEQKHLKGVHWHHPGQQTPTTL